MLIPAHSELSAVPNFRDVGGRVTANGRRVRRGLVFRSAAFGGASEDDRRILDQLNIRWVCDLRSEGERGGRPQGWPLPEGPAIWFREKAPTVGSLLDTVVAPGATAADVQAAMVRTYRALPFSHNEAFAQVLRRVASGDVPVAVHCSAGKDRTGVAVAILLDLLGVPRAEILEEYLLTQASFEPLAAFVLGGPKGDKLREAGREVWEPMIAVKADYLQSAFDAIDQRHGDTAGYARDALDFQDIPDLREVMLEPAQD